MKNIILVFFILNLSVFISYVIGINVGKYSEKERITKCIIGNEIGVNYYHFAKIGKCLNK